MRLYNSQLSGNCYKARLLLALLGTPYERIEVDVVDRSNRRELLGGKNPALRVPTLELDNGEHLAESNAIIWYLGDGTEYVPEQPLDRARVLQWMFFEQYEVEPAIAVARFWITVLGEQEKYAAELEGKWRAGNRALAALDEHLGGRQWLVGDAYSVADISLYGYTHMADEGGFDLGQYPAVQAWTARVAARPGHVPIEA
jgi:glutathione S-transferase